MKTTRGKRLGPGIVGVRDAKAQISRSIADVKNGGEWTIAERGNPIACLVPISRATLSFAERIRRLKEHGTLEAQGVNQVPLTAPLPLPYGLARGLLESDRDSLA